MKLFVKIQIKPTIRFLIYFKIKGSKKFQIHSDPQSGNFKVLRLLKNYYRSS